MWIRAMVIGRLPALVPGINQSYSRSRPHSNVGSFGGGSGVLGWSKELTVVSI